MECLPVADPPDLDQLCQIIEQGLAEAERPRGEVERLRQDRRAHSGRRCTSVAAMGAILGALAALVLGR